MGRQWWWTSLIAVAACTTGPVPPQVRVVAPEPALSPDARAGVSYSVDLSDAAQHLVHVSATARTTGAPHQVWMMPVWTPGSYLVRDYARHVERFRAVDGDGRALHVERIALNRWQIDVGQAASVTVRYDVYANDPSVRTAWVHADGSVLVGASLFITPLEQMRDPYLVALSGLSPDWTGISSPLHAAPGGGLGRFMARDFDDLIDGPIVAGALFSQDIEVLDTPHTYTRLGGEERWPDERALADLSRIVDVVTDFWGVLPYDRYTFLDVVADSVGGLEHKNGALIYSMREAPESPEGWSRWQSVMAHEFFHAWNVKRMRPEAFAPYDYEAPQLTSSLWIAEGLTSYYDDLMLVRAGLIEPDTYLSLLSNTLTEVMTRPGNDVQSLTDSSLEAWIKLYKPDEDSANATVNYYRKGAVVGFLLDATIRQATRGRQSLDDAMRAAWGAYGEQPYTEAQFRAVLSETAGLDLSPFFAAWVDGTQPLELSQALAWYGLKLAEDPQAGGAWLGLELQGSVVRSLVRHGPAAQAGLSLGDELLAIDGQRVSEPTIASDLKARAAGEQVTLLYSRNGQIHTATTQLGASPQTSWRLERDPTASRAVQQRRGAWLSGSL